jgi:hypothetical protein
MGVLFIPKRVGLLNACPFERSMCRKKAVLVLSLCATLPRGVDPIGSERRAGEYIMDTIRNLQRDNKHFEHFATSVY